MLKTLFAPLAMKVAAGLQILSLLAIAFLAFNLAAEKQRSAKWQLRSVETQAAFDKTVAEVHRVRAEQKAKDVEHAREIEQTQAKVSNEVSNEYQARLAALRARYDSLRAKASTPAGRTGAENVPELSDSAGRSDDAAEDYTFRCEADAIQLEALQDWIRGQVAVER